MENSIDVASAYGLALHQMGARSWACCPLHGEKTASLCFYPDGRWYCFGCHAHGDAADLYAALHGVTMGEALRAVNGETHRLAAPRKPTAADLRRIVENYIAGLWSQACEQKHAAQAAMATLEATHTPAQLAYLDAYWEAVRRAALADDTLEQLAALTPYERLQMLAEAHAT